MSLLAPPQASDPGYDNPMTRNLIAGILRLDGTQKTLFNNLLDTLRQQQRQMAPGIGQYQAQVRQAFASANFSAARLQQQWTARSAQQENRMAGETAFQMVNLWAALKAEQRQQAESQLNQLQSAWNSTAGKSLGDLQQKQARRLQGIASRLSLDPAQQGALQTMVLDPKSVLAWQQGIRREINQLIVQLRSPGANVRVLQKSLQPIYANERYLSVQLKKLETLHARLTPAQRQQLLLAMR